MSKIKIHEIAKKIGVASKEVLTKANEIGISVSSHLSSVEENDATKIIEAFKNKIEKKVSEKENSSKQTKQPQNKEKTKDTKKTDAPVIIRREVIINENDEKDVSKKKQEEKNKKDLIRVVRNKEGEITIDKTGKANGRGAYLCDNIDCLEKAIKNKRLERSFEMKIEDEIYEKLRGVMID